MFTGNGSSELVTVDDNGHIFTWLYSKERVTSKQRFEPAAKHRIELKYPRFSERTLEFRLFPPTGKKDIDPTKVIKDAAIV